MKATVFLAVLLCCLLGVKATIVIPDELPSLLSVIYSSIPTIKKGTDSRVGWGFRIGDRADFQILVELGPQTYTQKLANQADSSGGTKRNTLETLADKLYAQNQDAKRTKEEVKEEKKPIYKKPVNPDPNTNIDAAEWLKNWSSSVKQYENKTTSPKAKPGIAIGEIDAKSVLPDDDEDTNNEKMKVEISKESGVYTMKPITSTSKEEALDNVDLD